MQLSCYAFLNELSFFRLFIIHNSRGETDKVALCVHHVATNRTCTICIVCSQLHCRWVDECGAVDAFVRRGGRIGRLVRSMTLSTPRCVVVVYERTAKTLCVIAKSMLCFRFQLPPSSAPKHQQQQQNNRNRTIYFSSTVIMYYSGQVHLFN